MITRRDILIGLVASVLTATAFAVATQKPVLSSAIYPWNSIPARTTASGSVRSFFSGPTPTLKDLEVHVTLLNPGQAPHPPHRHGHEELLIIKQGTVEALIGGKWQAAGPGSVIFFASNQLHGVRNAGSEPAVYHVIGWTSADTPADAK